MINDTYDHVVDATNGMDIPELFYQVSAVKDGKYDVKFVSGIDQIELSSAVGYKITVIAGENTYEINTAYTLTDTVYESIIADGVTVGADEVGAGYDYLYSCTIAGIAVADELVINISAANVALNGETVYGEVLTLSIFNGIAHIVAK